MPTAHVTTVTANYGPGKRSSAVTIKNVSDFHVAMDRRMMTIIQESNVIQEFSTDGITSFTASFVGNAWTVTMSA